MKDSLKAGLESTLQFLIPETKTVPCLYPEVAEFRIMPRVFATGYLVGLVEWACMRALQPHLDLPREFTVGTEVRLTHEAATPPGLTATVRTRLEKIEGRRLFFSVTVHDGVEMICRGTHERFVIDVARFQEKLARKAPTSA